TGRARRIQSRRAARRPRTARRLRVWRWWLSIRPPVSQADGAPRGGARQTERATDSIDYLLLGHVTVDRLDTQRVALGGTATYAGLTARNLGARVGIHTSASYEPGLVDTLYGTQVARIPAEYTTC